MSVLSANRSSAPFGRNEGFHRKLAILRMPLRWRARHDSNLGSLTSDAAEKPLRARLGRGTKLARRKIITNVRPRSPAFKSGKKPLGAWAMKYATAMSPARMNATGRVNKPSTIDAGEGPFGKPAFVIVYFAASRQWDSGGPTIPKK